MAADSLDARALRCAVCWSAACACQTGTRIAGQTYATSDDDVASLYRFQGQEQETFPLSTLNINNSALAAWLDEIGFYHYPWRDYAAGFAAFAQTDPIPVEDSPYRAFGSNPANYTDETGGMWMDYYPRTYNPLPRGLPRRIRNMLEEIRNDPRMMDEDRLRTGRRIYGEIMFQQNNPHNPFDNYPVVIWDETSNKERIELREVSDEADIDEALRRFQVLRDEQYEWLGIYSRVLWPEWYPESNREPASSIEEQSPNNAPSAETNVPQGNQSNSAQQRHNEAQEEKTDSEEADDHDAKKCCVM
jgi:hypothetical protein